MTRWSSVSNAGNRGTSIRKDKSSRFSAPARRRAWICFRSFGVSSSDRVPAGGYRRSATHPRNREEELFEGREDLRDQFIVTIDPDDARDFDDAIIVERTAGGGWRLGVHIADVAAYVRPGSALDREAYQRGNSVYLPDRVIPMLPERLSNGVCSLKPGVNRLTHSVFIEFTKRSHKSCVSRTVMGAERAELRGLSSFRNRRRTICGALLHVAWNCRTAAQKAFRTGRSIWISRK